MTIIVNFNGFKNKITTSLTYMVTIFRHTKNDKRWPNLDKRWPNVVL